MLVDLQEPANGWGGLRPEFRAPRVSAQLMLLCYLQWFSPPEVTEDPKSSRRLEEWQTRAAKKIFNVNSLAELPEDCGMHVWFENRRPPSDLDEAKRQRCA